MNSYIDSIPSFWQGVIASIVATVLIAVAVGAFKIWSGSYNSWRDGLKVKYARLRADYEKGNDLTKIHMSVSVIFNVLKWLLLGNLLWVAPGFAAPFLDIYLVTIVFHFFSVVAFCVGLWWVYFFSTFTDKFGVQR